MDERKLESLRRSSGELENHLIDEYVGGHISRRELLRRASVIGMSLPVLGAVLGPELAGAQTRRDAAATPRPAASRRPGVPGGGTVKVGIVTPVSAINPLTIADQGGLDMLGQTGEYLCLSDQHLNLRPVLAEKWSANSSATVWTFKIRKGVTFSDGSPLTADDVVYTFQQQAAAKNSGLVGAVTAAGVKKVDDYTVAFHLESANGNFPYQVSSDNYNVIIVPKGSNFAKWQKTFIGTGPWKMQSYKTGVGATFVRNPHYWGPKAKPAVAEFSFYSEAPPQILALQSGAINVLGQFQVSGGEAILANPSQYNIIKLRSSAHRELSMRTDLAPFKDKRVRQAIALTLNRPAIVQALFKGFADLGNDSPFAPAFPSTVPLQQRNVNLRKARALLSAAGHPDGFSTTLYTEQFQEIPQLAQLIAQAASAIKVNIKLDIETQNVYYGNYKYGTSDWLDGTMSLVDYGNRSVPNVFLIEPLASYGTWNAARFKNKTYDALAKSYIGATDLSSQRAYAKKIEQLLLDETPIIYPYFYNYLSASSKNVTGAYPTAIGHIFVNNCVVR